MNISSISGVLSVGTAGIYAGSKHTLEAMTDALAEELQPLGVQVSAVNPGDLRIVSAGVASEWWRSLDGNERLAQ